MSDTPSRGSPKAAGSKHGFYAASAGFTGLLFAGSYYGGFTEKTTTPLNMIPTETPEGHHQFPEENGVPGEAAEQQDFPIPHPALFSSIFQPQRAGFFQ